MKTIFAVAFALAVALFGVSGVTSAWAGGGRPSVFPRPADPWQQWGRSGHGHVRPHSGGHFRDHRFRGRGHFSRHPRAPVIIVPGPRVAPAPRVFPGFWAWNGAGWVWVPSRWAR